MSKTALRPLKIIQNHTSENISTALEFVYRIIVRGIKNVFVESNIVFVRNTPFTLWLAPGRRSKSRTVACWRPFVIKVYYCQMCFYLKFNNEQVCLRRCMCFFFFMNGGHGYGCCEKV